MMIEYTPMQNEDSLCKIEIVFFFFFEHKPRQGSDNRKLNSTTKKFKKLRQGFRIHQKSLVFCVLSNTFWKLIPTLRYML